MGKLFVVGIGPGNLNQMTLAARAALEQAQVVVGYTKYLDLIRPLLARKQVVSSGMTKEKERCQEALRLAGTGKTVALVSSGDAGIYGMAGLALELAEGLAAPPAIEVVPGVSALQAAAAVLGAPLMHDFAVVSLSDLLTPWATIRQRLRAAAAADFVVALYNPKSSGRTTQLNEARQILLVHRPPTTPVGIVRNARRAGEEVTVTNLAGMLDHPVDMFTVVIVGNSQTFVTRNGRMVTPRGYEVRSEVKGVRSEKPALLTPHPSPLTHEGKALMFCGTGSDVGKSMLTAGFCRILANRGVLVAPFKSQNMALNSAVTPEGGEIGRAQAVQAAACRIPPHTDMNPVLLKPTTDTGSQVIIQGTVVGNMRVAEYTVYKPTAFAKVRESFARLREAYDVIVLEGAGSIAEINLKAHDIANLRMAELADCPVLLVADIDRGGVFAQIVGTLELLEPAERARIAGVIINKFRGDPTLLGPGIDFVEQRTGVPVLGVVPWFDAGRLPDEDSVALSRRGTGTGDRGPGKISIGVVKLPRIANFTDFDSLEDEPDVALSFLERPEELAGLDLLIIPGSKATIADLRFLWERGFAAAVRDFPGTVVGICGGLQMLGRRIKDPFGMESEREREAEGLGLLDAVTLLLEKKETHQARAELLPAGFQAAPRCREGLAGYEIHLGETILGPHCHPFARIVERSGTPVEVYDGAVAANGRVFGTYLHGIFDNPGFRAAFLNRLRRAKGLPEREASAPREDPFDLLAAHLEQHLDVTRILTLCGLPC